MKHISLSHWGKKTQYKANMWKPSRIIPKQTNIISTKHNDTVKSKIQTQTISVPDKGKKKNKCNFFLKHSSWSLMQ